VMTTVRPPKASKSSANRFDIFQLVSSIRSKLGALGGDLGLQTFVSNVIYAAF